MDRDYKIVLSIRGKNEHIVRREHEIADLHDAMEWLNYEADMLLHTFQQAGLPNFGRLQVIDEKRGEVVVETRVEWKPSGISIVNTQWGKV